VKKFLSKWRQMLGLERKKFKGHRIEGGGGGGF